MTIRKKLKIGMATPLLIFLVFALVFYLQTRWIGDCLKQITEVEQPKSEAVAKMELELAGTGFELLGYLRDHDRVRLERIGNYKEDFRKYQNVYSRVAETEEAKLSAIAVDKDYAELSRAAEELIHIEDYQVQRLDRFRANSQKIETILNEEFESYLDPDGQGTYDRLNTLIKIKAATEAVGKEVSCYLISHRQQCENRIYENQEEVGQLIKTYKQQYQVPQHGDSFEQLGDIYAQNTTLVNEIVMLDRRKQTTLADFVKIKENLSLALRSNTQKAHANFKNARNTSYRAVYISTVITIVLVVCGLIIALISQGYIAYLTSIPIMELNDAADKICRGKYNIKIDIDSNDELSELAQSIAEMAHKLKKMQKVVDECAKEAACKDKAGTAV